MNLKVTIEKDGIPYEDEIVVSKDFAPLFIVKSIERVLNKADLMEKGEILEILGSDESTLLSKSGY
tara:strand:+ start:1901 stop:2098 length:198 start_codon:yes stop_codon:yes gene_type:complete